MGAILACRAGAILTLELSNPRKSNALDMSMLLALDRHVSDVEADDTVRALVLRGSAGGVFSSGADIRDWSAMSPTDFSTRWIGEGNAIFRRFERLRCPTVAVIEGLCFGGGLELALCCDLRVASSAARLCFPEVGIGSIPGWEGGYRLQRIAGRGRALEAVLLAGELDASTAERWGVLTRVCEPGRLDAELSALVSRLIQVSPRAAAIAKSLIFDERDPSIAYPAAALEIRSSPDAEIGIRAFLNKTSAVF